jgi:hypothetical protein
VVDDLLSRFLKRADLVAADGGQENGLLRSYRQEIHAGAAGPVVASDTGAQTYDRSNSAGEYSSRYWGGQQSRAR